MNIEVYVFGMISAMPNILFARRHEFEVISCFAVLKTGKLSQVVTALPDNMNITE